MEIIIFLIVVAILGLTAAAVGGIFALYASRQQD
jgi:hypothetical protein